MAQLDRQLTPELYAIGATTTATSLLAILLSVAGLMLLRRTQALTRRP